MSVLNFKKITNDEFCFVCTKDTPFRKLKDFLAEYYDVYRQRVLLDRSYEQFGKTVYRVKIVGGMDVRNGPDCST